MSNMARQCALIISAILLTPNFTACSKNSLLSGGLGKGSSDSTTTESEDSAKGDQSDNRPPEKITEEFTVSDIQRKHDIVILSGLNGTEPEAQRLFPFMVKLPENLPTEGFDYRFVYAGLMPLAMGGDASAKYEESIDFSERISPDETDLLDSLSRELASGSGFRARAGSTLHVIVVSVTDRTPDKIDDDDGVITATYLDVTIPREVFIHGLLPLQEPGSNDAGCAYQPAKEYLSFNILHRGNRFHICRNDWKVFAGVLGKQLAEQGKRFVLKRLPNAEDKISVTVNDSELTEGDYSIDQISWHLVLKNPANMGDVVKITYTPR